ncbi:enoyl-CoA delta isomerase 1, mitochondrial-like [Microcaecilia unicolor]|uniref:Enoyl-CoA delta isomerase 1, mitochondrial-like n=1 Tax=Microcaecilia unicolor TaxID=1415580 RepID=A0A6P7X2G2_9AMPH|nr:enoyl-CoA delta isomerase 1, mitochondrial-like [Microcaecilia unicolor]
MAAALMRFSSVRLLAATLSPYGVHQKHGQISNQRRQFSNTYISVEMDDATGVAVMKMKRPPVNSLNLELLTEFAISLEKLEIDRGCRGVILTSAIPKIFSAGLDITEMCGKNADHYGEFWRALQEMWLKLYGSNMVTIAAINASILYSELGRI